MSGSRGVPERLKDASSTRLLKLATRSSVGVSVMLVVTKSVAWVMTGSVSVLASLLDSLMDTAASVINLVAVDYSLKPADAGHRFGHGKAEALAGLGQSVFIALSAGLLFYHASDRLVAPQPAVNVDSAFWVIGFALVVTLALIALQRYVVARTGSTAVRADSLHFVSDVFTNIATLAALALMQRGYLRADSVFGLLIGVFIFYSAVRVGWSAVRILMDEELPDPQRNAILSGVTATPGVVAVRRLRSWRSGQKSVVHLDVEFDGERTLADVHENSEQVRARILEIEPDADVSILAWPKGP